MTFDWNHARAFLSVAELGSLSATARQLGQTQPTISRQITALEEALGVTLFERTGRAVILTDAAADLLEHVRRMAKGADLLSLAASGQSQSVAGTIRISASEFMCGILLGPSLAALRQTAPQLEIDLIADNDVSDLIRREADIAIRHVRPEEPGLIRRRLADLSLSLYASDAYLTRHGEPRADDLKGHHLISYAGVDGMLAYLRPAGLAITAETIRLRTSSHLAAWALAEAGLGMIVAPDRVALERAQVRRVLQDIGPFQIPTWLVAHRELRTNRRVRLVFDQLVQDFG